MNRGFGLISLLIAIAVIAIIATSLLVGTSGDSETPSVYNADERNSILDSARDAADSIENRNIEITGN